MITVLPVRSPREKRLFLTFPWRVFQGDPLWVPPLLPDLAERTDPRRGLFFRRRGKAEFFIAWRDDQVVGWLPGLPNLNEAFIHANGLRRPWDYLKLLWYMRQKTRCLTLKSILVLPEYWGSGLAILLFDEMAKRARARGYRWIDGSLTSADNPRTPALADRLGGQLYKRYRVYGLRL